jgi:rubrerythrin
MERTVLLDLLSEFLMVEQGGLELYRVAAARCTDAALAQRYAAFGEETARHREILVRLIERLGGDPAYVSPTARLAQAKAAAVVQTALVADGLSQPEREAADLENVLLAETKDHADWHLLQLLAAQVDDAAVRTAFEETVPQVEEEEDEHLSWARDTLADRTLRRVMRGPAAPPARWQRLLTGPEPPIDAIHPAPITEGLLPPSEMPQWGNPPALRELQGTVPAPAPPDRPITGR